MQPVVALVSSFQAMGLEPETRNLKRPVLTVKSAREIILKHCQKVDPRSLPTEALPILECFQRVIAEPIFLDRDQPPFDRSMRDGYGVRSVDVKDAPVSLRTIGEIKAGDPRCFEVNEGEAVQIMTGAPVPAGADAVVMVEYTERLNHQQVRVLKSAKPGDNIARRGSECKAGELIVDVGKNISSFELAVLATVGKSKVKVFHRPAVSILASGDELVDVNETPGPGQIRNSNSFSLYGQVLKCGAVAKILKTARDDLSDLEHQVKLGLENDVLLVSGGVSVGTYDLVEQVFSQLGMQVHFESISMRPGKPTVFATLRDRFVFGLPGNPLSTFVAFELFVRPVLNTLQGLPANSLSLITGILRKEVIEKSGRTAFLPARVSSRLGQIEVSPVPWKGSADIFSVVGANGFVIVPREATRLNCGDPIEALLFDEIQFASDSQF